jgi:glycosyltransferase involved in cell wall biosynthesis
LSKPTVIFYESNYFRFYGAGMVLLWTMQHLERVQPVFVTAGEGALTQRVRAAGIETLVLPTPDVWRKMQSRKGVAGKLLKAAATPTLAAHVRDLFAVIRTRGAVGVHANSTRAALLAGLAARAAGVPMWWHLRRERPMRVHERLAYELCDQVICIARAVRRTLGDPPKAVVIHDGIPANRLDYNASGAALKARLNWPADALVVGAAASLAPNKRHDLFIHMALTLAKAFPQAHFLIAGHRPAGVSAAYEAELHALARPLEETGRLAFLDWVEEMSEVFAAIDIFVHPSDNEGLGLAPIEAMQMGAPVVRTDTAGAEDMIQDGRCGGFIIPRGDGDALVDRVQRLLADEALRRRLGRAGMDCARSEFTARRMTRQLEDLMLASAKRSGR